MSIWADWTLAELKGFRKSLTKAIATGAEDVGYGDRRVRYRSLDDMRKAAAEIDAEIQRREGTGYRTRQIRLQPVKGFE